VLAPGTIAGDFVSTVLANTDQRVTAVGSRSGDRARRFADAHGIDRVHGSYDSLVSDANVDIVYVAAPHSEHYPLALQAISAGKHVLIEKPIAVTALEASEIAEAARAAGVFAAEAIWTRYLPQFNVLDQVLRRGDLGVIRLATADVGWAMGPDAPSRMLDPTLGGGSALDMGVYGYWFAQFAIGPPRVIRAVGSMTATGVDDQNGSARFLDPFVLSASFVVSAGPGLHEWKDPSGLSLRAGLAWQTTAVADYIGQGRIDSPVHSLDDAISVMHTIDTVRRQLREALQAPSPVSDARSAPC
jgi:predicted dehydrogenase